MGFGDTKLISTLPHPIRELKSVALSETLPNIFIHCSNSCILSVWNLLSEQPLKFQESLGACAESICISSDNTSAALGLANGFLQVLSLDRNEPIFVTKAHDSVTCSVDFHPFSNLVATSSGSWIKIWDLRCKSHFRSFQLKDASIARRIRFSPDGSWIALACDNNCAMLLDVITGKVVAEFPQDGAVAFVEFHPSELMLCSASPNCKVNFWDLGDCTHISSCSIINEELTSIKFHSEGSCVFTGTQRGTIMAFGWESNELFQCINTNFENIFCIVPLQSKIVSVVGTLESLNILETLYEFTESSNSCTEEDVVMIDDEATYITSEPTFSNKTFTKQETSLPSTFSNSDRQPLYHHVGATLLEKLYTPHNTVASTADAKDISSWNITTSFNLIHASSTPTELSTAEIGKSHHLHQSSSTTILYLLHKATHEHSECHEILSKRNSAYASVNRMIKAKNYVGAIKSAEACQDVTVMMDLIEGLVQHYSHSTKDFPTFCIIQALRNMLTVHQQEETHKFAADNLTALLRQKLTVSQITTFGDCKDNLDDKSLLELQQLRKALEATFPNPQQYPYISYILLITSLYSLPH